jgi:glycosyltransferase involved in cell wall biosynthesis
VPLTGKAMSKPLVSIIIPSYNSIHFLDETLNSALNQSYGNIEVILVDDGSTDGTKKAFPRFESMGVKCIFQENAGGTTARNTGLTNANGEYIQFLDADDVLHREKIEKQILMMDSEDSELSFTLWNCFSNDINEGNKFQFSPMGQFNHIDFSRKWTGEELMISFGTDDWWIPTVAWLTKLSLIRKAGYWNPSVYPNEDGEYFSRILFFSEKVICIDKVLAHYRVLDSESTSTLNSEKKILGAFKSWQLIHALVATSSNPKLLSYPKNAYRFLYYRSIWVYPNTAKIIAKEFDRIEENCFSKKGRWFSWFANIFGLHRTFRMDYILYRAFQRCLSAKKMKNILRFKKNNEGMGT